MFEARKIARLVGAAGGLFARIDASFNAGGAEAPGNQSMERIMNIKTNRRTVLSTTAAGLAAGAIAAPPMAAEAGEHPDAELFHLEVEYRQTIEAWHDLVGVAARMMPNDPDFDRAEEAADIGQDAAEKAFRRVMKTPARTPAGLASKIRMHDLWNTDGYGGDACHCLESLMADIQAMGARA
ncbi:MAG: hypothetical protein VYD64_02565 [Pseudomonadota bacterium]|nr:hypothetical protein [Pseudomonadota bacterium]